MRIHSRSKDAYTHWKRSVAFRTKAGRFQRMISFAAVVLLIASMAKSLVWVVLKDKININRSPEFQ